MKFTTTALNGVYIIDLDLRQDERGAFARTFCRKEFTDNGLEGDFVQFNQSWNLSSGTLRGMHFQKPPFSEVKLIRCIRGAVQDVIVDVRRSSKTFLQYLSVELTEQNNKMIYVPAGFAHGFITLTDNTQLLYHHTEYYKPDSEGGLKYNDPAIGIQWQAGVKVISDRDESHSLINNQFKGI
jgi:dTDP-4-dehydrorhamnose 3,5-epimerase